jgi:hypothetical protein
MSYYSHDKLCKRVQGGLRPARGLLRLQSKSLQPIVASFVMIHSLGFRKSASLLTFGVATIGLAMAAPAGATIITFDLGLPTSTSSTQSVYTINGYTLTVDNPLPSGSVISQTNTNGVCTYTDYFSVRGTNAWCGQTGSDLASTKWTISPSAPAVQLISYDLRGITTSSTANNGTNDTAAVFTTIWTGGDSSFTSSQNLSGGALGSAGTGATVNFMPGIFATSPFTVTTTSTTAGSLSYRIKTLTVLVPTPGPLPILGGAAAMAFSRKLRSRIKATS